ncbi:hypothetical protein ES708_33985 [subsurface metagenome]
MNFSAEGLDLIRLKDLSLYLFLVHQPYLIYIVNCLIDGLIGFVVLGFYLKLTRLHE